MKPLYAKLGRRSQYRRSVKEARLQTKFSEGALALAGGVPPWRGSGQSPGKTTTLSTAAKGREIPALSYQADWREAELPGKGGHAEVAFSRALVARGRGRVFGRAAGIHCFKIQRTRFGDKAEKLVIQRVP